MLNFFKTRRQFIEANDFIVLQNLVEANRDEADLEEMAYPAYFEGNLLSRWLFSGRLARVLSPLEHQKGDLLLEFGCGLGMTIPYLTTKGCIVVGVDLFPQIASRYIEELGVTAAIYGSLDKLSDMGSFDLICALDVLEHVNDLDTILNQFMELINDKGTLVVSGPTENALYRLGRRIVGFKGDYHHRNIMDIMDSVLKAGFVTKKTIAWPVPGPMCLFRCGYFSKP